MRRLELALAIIIAALCIEASTRCAVGGREQGPSEVLTETDRAYSDPALVPAPGDRTGDVIGGGVAQPGRAPAHGDAAGIITEVAGSNPAPASTVTQSVLTQEGGGILGDPVTPYVPSRPTAVTSSVGGGALTPSASYTAVDHVPVTPVATPARVETQGGVSNNSAGKDSGPELYQGDLEAQVRAAVERYFPPAEWTKAMRVAWCESRYQPWAVEPGGAHVGVFQLDPSLHGSVPADIDGQVRQAADLWRRAGWGPWECQ